MRLLVLTSTSTIGRHNLKSAGPVSPTNTCSQVDMKMHGHFNYQSTCPDKNGPTLKATHNTYTILHGNRITTAAISKILLALHDIGHKPSYVVWHIYSYIPLQSDRNVA